MWGPVKASRPTSHTSPPTSNSEETVHGSPGFQGKKKGFRCQDEAQWTNHSFFCSEGVVWLLCRVQRREIVPRIFSISDITINKHRHPNSQQRSFSDQLTACLLGVALGIDLDEGIADHHTTQHQARTHTSLHSHLHIHRRCLQPTFINT